jgi:hypothetical protein
MEGKVGHRIPIERLDKSIPVNTELRGDVANDRFGPARSDGIDERQCESFWTASATHRK